MMLLSGEVRRVVDDNYTDKNKKKVRQAVLIIEPESSRQNYEVYLNRAQVDAGLIETWSKLKGKKASIAVSLFVSYEYKFHKLNAVGDGQPFRGKLP